MRSVLQCQSTGVVPRCTTSQSLPLVTFSLTLIITLTINICESANAEIGRPLTSNRALLAEFPLFLQHSQTGQVVAVEVDQTATIKQLYELAAETFGADSVQLRLGGVLIENADTPLADWSDGEGRSGISAEAQIEVVVHRRSDISQLLDMMDDDMKSRFFSDAELQRIRELNEQAMQSADGDIYEVIKFITLDIPSEHTGRPRPIIYRIQRYADTQPMRATDRDRISELAFRRLDANLRWQHLPKLTERLSLNGGSVTAIDFRGIECENLRYLWISDMHQLEHLELSGLEKCTKLETLGIGSNAKLTRVSIAPLEHCRKLRWLYLCRNALEDLDLSPLSRSSSLKEVRIYDNRFSRDVEEIKEPLRALTERGLTWMI